MREVFLVDTLGSGNVGDREIYIYICVYIFVGMEWVVGGARSVDEEWYTLGFRDEECRGVVMGVSGGFFIFSFLFFDGCFFVEVVSLWVLMGKSFVWCVIWGMLD